MKIKIKTPAKINLFLDVIERDKNNYHKIITIFQAITLFDKIIIKESEYDKIISNIKSLETTDNLIFRAINLIREKYNINKKFYIKLNKNIPIGAGLGGGSSDAAAVILGLIKKYHIPINKKEILKLGMSIGSDVNFFLNGCKTQIGEGYGNILSPISTNFKYYIILIYPDIHISTKENYKMLSKNMFKKGEKYLDEIYSAIKEKKVDKLINNLYNIFEYNTFKRYYEIKEIKEELLKEGANNALMSGSGSSVYAICKEKNKAKKIYKKLKKKYKNIYLIAPYYGDVQIK